MLIELLISGWRSMRAERQRKRWAGEAGRLRRLWLRLPAGWRVAGCCGRPSLRAIVRGSRFYICRRCGGDLSSLPVRVFVRVFFGTAATVGVFLGGLATHIIREWSDWGDVWEDFVSYLGR